MAHWFDTLSKNAARFDGIERRSFLALGAIFGAGALNGRAQAQEAPRPAGGALGATAGAPTRRIAGALVIQEVSAERSGLSAQISLAFNRTTQNATISATITRGSQLVAKIDVATTKGGAGTQVINYGPAVSGVKNVTVSTKNGKTFQGTVDGRAFTLAGTPTPLKDIQFLDHAAPPVITVDPAITAALPSLGVQANALLRSPSSAPAGSPAAKGGHSVEAPVPGSKGGAKRHRPEPSGPGSDWYEPSDDPVDCTVCENDCGTNVGSWILDIFSFGASEPEYWAACMAVCNLPGGGCLPTPCGSFTTCAKSDTCFSFQGGRLCCPAPSALCKNVCCGREITSCGSDGTCGCPTGTKVCGDDCCNPNQACCNGACCEPGQVCTDGVCCNPGVTVCEGVCCGKGQVCHGGKCCNQNNICGPTCCDELSTCLDASKGVCCGFDQPVCGSICCPLGSVCLNGKCCAPNSLCGGICCPDGHTCANASKHTCTACPSPTVPCLSTNGIGLCCPAGVECCGQTCCPPNSACQQSGNTYICVPMHIQ